MKAYFTEEQIDSSQISLDVIISICAPFAWSGLISSTPIALYFVFLGVFIMFVGLTLLVGPNSTKNVTNTTKRVYIALLIITGISIILAVMCDPTPVPYRLFS
jgi:hypothetical protein